MEKRTLIHDGVTIKVHLTEDPSKVIISFTDEISAFGGIKRAVIKDKGLYCNGIACLVSKAVQEGGVPTYFIEKYSEREQLCKHVNVIPLQMIVRNVVAGSLSQRLGLEEGVIPSSPMFDLCYKSDELGDPMINDYHALALGLTSRQELDSIYHYSRRINEILVPLFEKAGITLVDFKIEFGRDASGTLMLSDDITPDNARFWDIATGMRLDKDRFRRDESRVGESYKAVYDRLKKVCEE
ncbi:MAG: phosphoribosylaminoimidazolesuccinocarboxamide synthase [Bacteroidales bacterium]|nr:phosphoribosylaminoimidazolesuccinocarboxamide synthase [Bacteroidales bacterium]